MSAEELDTAQADAYPDRRVEAVIKLAEAWVDKNTDEEGMTNVAGGIIRSLISHLMSAGREVERLRKVIEGAPHGDDCRAFPQFAALLGIAARPCTCWKASAVGTNKEEGN